MQEVMTLKEYIVKYYSGSMSAFGRAYGKQRQQVFREMNNRKFIVVNGEVAQLKYEKV